MFVKSTRHWGKKSQKRNCFVQTNFKTHWPVLCSAVLIVLYSVNDNKFTVSRYCLRIIKLQWTKLKFEAIILSHSWICCLASLFLLLNYLSYVSFFFFVDQSALRLWVTFLTTLTHFTLFLRLLCRKLIYNVALS